jgi:peptidoglycan/xylan/chitin deacetylase (PgdA/CDA1 family)
VGIIANSFGEDKAITEVIKNNLKNDEITIANHGLDSTPFTLFDKNKQESMLKESSDIIHKKLNVDSKIFIPPQNRFNDDTENVLKENGFTYLSASMLSDSAPFPLKNQDLYRFPELATTGEYVPSQNRIMGASSDKTFSDAMNAIHTHGFTVITIHPQEYAVFQGGEYLNEVNESQMAQLKLLIEKIHKQNIQLVSLDEIDSKIKIIPTKVQMLDNSLIPSWVKNNAGWWRDGFVDDRSFLYGLEYLIKNNMIKIPPTVLKSNNSQIPPWVKDNAGWWAEGRISDDDFIYGVSYLVNHGIIIVDM